MYILSNALKNLARNKGRNILSGAIILAVVVSTAVSLIIYTASAAVISGYKEQFGARVYINPDMDRLSVMSGRPSAQTVPLRDVYARLADSEHLLAAELCSHVPSVSDTLRGLGETGGGAVVPVAPNGGSAARFPTMNVKGYSDIGRNTDFTDGLRGLVSGVFPHNDFECIVSEDFAELNGLAVGDTIRIAQGMVENNPLTLKVVGIYFDFTTNMFGSAIDAPAAINVRNDIITNYKTAFDYGKTDPRSDTAAYELKSPELLPAFEREARAAGLSLDYKVTIDEDAYNKIVGPVQGMANISLTFMAVVLILGGLVLLLLSSLFIRERKYEVGVLRAMGMKKKNVAVGLVLESLAITSACLIIGLCA
ncbi:MAG: ABC transporter permease, partial [Defluviitaleaceae bacterium]|nr:ABC transporter permease [Defluviitaleaceae bacterium]